MFHKNSGKKPCFCQDGLNWSNSQFKPLMAETCQPCRFFRYHLKKKQKMASKTRSTQVTTAVGMGNKTTKNLTRHLNCLHMMTLLVQDWLYSMSITIWHVMEVKKWQPIILHMHNIPNDKQNNKKCIPRNTLCQLKSCQLLHSCTNK